MPREEAGPEGERSREAKAEEAAPPRWSHPAAAGLPRAAPAPAAPGFLPEEGSRGPQGGREGPGPLFSGAIVSEGWELLENDPSFRALGWDRLRRVLHRS